MTHHARPPIETEGDRTFLFVTGGIRDALERARVAAGGMDVRVGGGPNTIQQYLRESLIDELHIAIAPVLLGGGERLFEGVDLRALGYECVEFVASEKAAHVVLRHQGRTDAALRAAAEPADILRLVTARELDKGQLPAYCQPKTARPRSQASTERLTLCIGE
jgi:RibD C-terminal domain